MGNCLKTQLKSEVQNSNLDYVGYTRLHINGTLIGIDVDFYGSSNPKSYIIDGTSTDVVFSDTGTKEHNGRITPSVVPINVAKDYYIEFDKYNVLAITLQTSGTIVEPVLNISDLKYSSKLWKVESRQNILSGDISALNNGSTAYIGVTLSNSRKLTGSIDSLLHIFDDSAYLKAGQTTRLDFVMMDCTNVEGNLKNFIDHLATIAHEGNKMLFGFGGTRVDITGFESGVGTVTFDGNGSYTVAY